MNNVQTLQTAQDEWDKRGLRNGFQKFCLNLYNSLHSTYRSFFTDPDQEAEKDLIRVFGSNWRNTKG